jgi:transposase
MRDGLLATRFIPPQGQRDVRDLTRDRTKLGQERSREVNRVQGVLERANIKLASVATDSMGVSGRAILAALIAGRADPMTMAELAKGRMRTKIPLLAQALTGLRRDHDRRLLALQLAHIDCLDEPLAALSAEMTRDLTVLEPGEPSTPAADTPLPVGEPGDTADPDATGDTPLSVTGAITLLDTLPGVDQRGAELLVAEWGTDRRRVGTASRLSAWTGVAPGHDESAGKPRSGKTRKGHRSLRTGLTHIAHAAVRTKGTYLSALSHRLAARRGKQRAITAVAHALVVRAFHRLSRHEPSRELGPHDLDERRRDHLVDRLTRRMQR